MRKRGVLENVKLYYEDLPSVSKFKKPKNKKSQSKSKKDIMDNNMVLGFALLVPVIFQKRLVNRHTVLSNLDDRETLCYNASMATNSNPETKKVLANIDNWISDYKSGLSCPDIAIKYGVHKSTVHRRLKERRVKIRSKSESKLAERNPIWKGDKISYGGLHLWVKARVPKPEKCVVCNERKAIDLANISFHFNKDTYTRDLTNWRWLCRKCHMLEDGRMLNLNRKGKIKKNDNSKTLPTLSSTDKKRTSKLKR